MSDESSVNGHLLPNNGNIDLGSSRDIGNIISAVRIMANAIDTSGQIDGVAFVGDLIVTDNTAAALAIGANGATNPVLKVAANASNVATGVSITGAAAASGVAIAAISSGSNETISIDGKGAGQVNIACTSTGDVVIGDATNPAFKVDHNASSATTGLAVTAAAAASGVALSVLSSGTNESMTIDAKGSGSITLNATGTGDIVAGRKIELYKIGSAASSVSGLLMGVGTEANPATTSTADAKFVEIRAQTTATSGDNRLAYLMYDMNGAAGGGECLRSRGYITATNGTARGAHISAELTAAGSVSGLCVGCDAQLMIADALPAGGTYYAGQSQIWAPASSSVAAVTTHAIHSFTVDGGDATAQATVKNCFAINGAEGTGNMIYNNNSTGATESNGSIRILVNEGSGFVPRYLRYWDAENS